MKNTILVVLIVVAAVLGYWVGQNNAGMNVSDKTTQDSITMMKKQSVSIQQMSEMMKSNGIMMQEMGAKYDDTAMISSGKDMAAIGKKHMDENMSASGAGTMKQMMGN